MDEEKESFLTKVSTEEGLVSGETEGDMEHNDGDEVKEFRGHNSEDDGRGVDPQDTTQVLQSNLSIPDSDNEDCNKELNISEVEKCTKDDLLIDPNDEKKSPMSPSPPRVSERSVPVSLKLQKKAKNNVEINNNNVDDIQPQFKELSLHSPNSNKSTKNDKRNSSDSTKCLRFYLEAVCKATTSQSEILNISCEPLFDPASQLVVEQEQELDSSGNLADVSKTISSLSSSPMSYIPPPPIHLTRMSYVSSSSGSSFPSSAALLSPQKIYKNPIKLEALNQSRINYLTKKWKNSNLVYGILDCIDKIMCEDMNSDIQVLVSKTNCGEKRPHGQTNLDSVPEEATSLSSRKRQPSPEAAANLTSKRLKPSSPIASTSFEELLGSEIFAKWQNRKYYFAHVTNVLDENHLQVVFLDTTVRTVTRDQIICELDALIGHKIMVTDETEGEKYYPGIVTSFFVDDGVFKYSVLTDSGDFEASVAQIYFTEHQARLIKQSAYALARASADASSLSPGCSGMQKELSDTGSETDGSPSKVDSDKHIMGCDIETNDPQNLSPSVKLKSVQGKLPKRSNRHEDTLLGPLKYKGSWFKGLGFMITCSTRAASSSTEEVQTDSEDYPFTMMPFVYDRLIQQIKLGGGEVFEKFDDIHPGKYSSTYLVTNRPCLTPKYLKCLAAGITIVCHEWIVNSTIKQKRQPLLDLPAGWSVENNKFINMFDRKTSQPLSGLRIRLAQLTDHNFYKFWSDICNIVGATALMFTGNFENTDVIVAENGLKDAILDKAAVFGVPVVSTSWIIQSIIHGEVRPYDGHPSYNHLYEETEEF